MSDAHNSCSVCDRRIDAYGRDGTRCARCDADCPVCGRDVACCPHPLPKLEQIEGVQPVLVRPRLPDRRYSQLHQRCAAGTIAEDERAELDMMCAMKEREADEATL